MRLLVISSDFPHPDQASSDLRFFTLLSLRARTHKVVFCALNADGTRDSRCQTRFMTYFSTL